MANKTIDIKTLAGNIALTLVLNDSDSIEYSYSELKDIFSNIDGYFSIIQDNIVIFNNLYNLISKNFFDKVEEVFPISFDKSLRKSSKHIKTKLIDLTIIYHNYNQDDINKIKHKYQLGLFPYFYKPRSKPNENNNLATEFELSDLNLEDDKLFMLFCVNLDGGLLSYASESLKNDKELVIYAYNEFNVSFQYASDNIKNDIEFVENNLYVPSIFKYLKDLKNNKEFVIRTLEKSFDIIGNVDNKIINDTEFIDEILKLKTFNCSVIKYFNQNTKNNKEIIMKCIKVNPSSLYIEDIGDKLQYDREIIIECLKQDGSQLKDIPEDCQLDNELILLGLRSGFTKIECWEEYENILDYIDTEFRRNKTIVIEAIRRHGNNYHYASKILKNDPEVIIEAINNCWWDTFKYDDKMSESDIIKSINEVDKRIKRIMNETTTRNENISNAIIEKLRKQYI